jgi:hypothetical protein
MKRFTICFLCALLAGCGGGKQHVFGKLAQVTGTVKVFAAARGSWEPADNGTPVCSGDSLQTSGASGAAVAFGNNTITLSENTRITISDTVDGEKKRLIAVLNTGGEVLSDDKDIEKHGARYEVWTPTAVAHAEGTQFTVAFSPQPYTTQVRVLDGRVRVFNPFLPSAPPVFVSPGCYTTVGYNAAPVAAVPMNYGQFKKMQRVLGPRYYHDYEVRFHINPEVMVLDAPIVVVPIIPPPMFFPPGPPMPRGPHGFFVAAPFLLPPGPGMPLPRGPHGGMISPVPPMPPGLPFPPSPGMALPLHRAGRVVAPGPGPMRPMPAPHGQVFKVERSRGGTGHGDEGDRGKKERHDDRKR